MAAVVSAIAVAIAAAIISVTAIYLLDPLVRLVVNAVEGAASAVGGWKNVAVLGVAGAAAYYGGLIKI